MDVVRENMQVIGVTEDDAKDMVKGKGVISCGNS